MTILIFVRHGETAWSKNQEHRVRGRLEIPLSEHGLAQARAVGKHLKDENLSAIYSSPLKRAINTAAEIAKFHGLTVINHYGFIDLSFGDWQGKTHSSINEQFPGLYHKWRSEPQNFQFPNGENLQIVRERIEKAINGLVKKHKNDHILISTHGAVLRVIICFLHNLGNEHYWDFRMDNCGLTIAQIENGKISIVVQNDTEHLKTFNSEI